MMSCKHARTMIALAVGQDLDDSADRTVQEHVAACAECRRQATRLKKTLRVLRKAEDAPGFVREASLWPAIAAQVEARRRTAMSDQFNGWVPALAVLAASALIAIFWNQSASVDSPWHQNLSAREMMVYEDRDGRLYIDPSWAAQHADSFSKKPQVQWGDDDSRSWSVQFSAPSDDF